MSLNVGSLNLGKTLLFVSSFLVGGIACNGGGGDFNRTRTIGLEGSLHQGVESLALLELEHEDEGVLLGEAKAVLPSDILERSPFDKSLESDPIDPSILSAFSTYPSSFITSRAFAGAMFVSRNQCLSICFAHSSCGSVVYYSNLTFCQVHGPNLPTDKLISQPVSTSKGSINPDTYVLPQRKAEVAGDADWLIEGNMGNAGADEPLYVKILYTDKTASGWKNMGEFFHDQTLGLTVSAPFKRIEGVVVAMKSKGTAVIDAFAFGLAEIYGQGPFANYLFYQLGFKLDGACESDKTNFCSDTLVLPANSKSDAQFATLKDLSNWRQELLY